MKQEGYSEDSGFEITEDGKDGIKIALKGSLDASSSPGIIKRLVSILRKSEPGSLTVDMEKVNYLDDFGVLLLSELKRISSEGAGDYRLKNLGKEAKEILFLHHFPSMVKGLSQPHKQNEGAMVRLGNSVIRDLANAKDMIFFIGSVIFSFFSIARRPRGLRLDDTLSFMHKTGVAALPIVGLISFLLGLIMAFMSSVQLQQFGANIYVASLVGLAMTRELGPIMTSIIVAGRSGSAFAAEIGTMKVSEEVDALFTMGFDPVVFLVAPRMIASVIVVPLLTLFSSIFAMAGGLVVGVSMLDLTASAYINQTVDTLTLFDIYWGVFKSGVFAIIISFIGCLRGFQVIGGPSSVGQATTSAVVSSIFMIIVIDSLFAVILRYWG